MGGIRLRIEKGLEGLGHFLCRWSVPVILIQVIMITALAWQIPDIIVETSTESMLHKNDPDRLDYNAFRDQFGRTELIIVAAESDRVFSKDFFSRLKALQEDLEKNTPFVRDVTSLINVRNIRGENDQLIIEDLTKDWPQTDEDFTALKRRVNANPLYKNHVISADGRVAAVIIETQAHVDEKTDEADILAGFDEASSETKGSDREKKYFSEQENQQVVEAVNAIVNRHQAKGFKLSFTGSPVITDQFNRFVVLDTEQAVLLALIANIIFLTIMFRRITGVIFPVLIVLSAMVCTLGLMPLLGVTFKITSTIIPAFLVAVGLADSVHILAIFYRRLKLGGNREQAICHAMGHSGLAIVMTSMTTVAGLLSFSFAELAGLSEMGIFAAIGVVFALGFTLFLLPPFLYVCPIKPARKKTTARKNKGLMNGFLLWFADFSTSHPWPIIGVSTVLLIVPACFLPRLMFSNDVVSYFRDSLPAKVNLLNIEKKLRGTMTIEAVLDGGKPDAFHDPGMLNAMEAFTNRVRQIRHEHIYVGKVFSINDIIKEINQAMHGNDPDFYNIPETKAAVAQEMLLYEMSGYEELGKLVQPDYSKARITIKTPWADSEVLRVFIQKVMAVYKETVGTMAGITLTGETALVAKTVPAALRSMSKSYIIAFIVITVMMLLLVGDVKTGLAAMFPNLLPIILVMGCLGLIGVRLNFNTLMIGSIAMGLVVDDTMHFMYNYRRHFMVKGDSREAVRYTLLGTGRAMLITSVVLCSGFSVLLAGNMKSSMQFGLFTTLIIIIALLADFLLAPALMTVMNRQTEKRGTYHYPPESPTH